MRLEAGPQPAGRGGGMLTHACTLQSVSAPMLVIAARGGVQGRSGQSLGAQEMPRQAGAQASGQTSPFKAGSFPTTWTVCVDDATPTRTVRPAPPLPGVPTSRHPSTAAMPPEQGAGPGPRAPTRAALSAPVDDTLVAGQAVPLLGRPPACLHLHRLHSQEMDLSQGDATGALQAQRQAGRGVAQNPGP